MARFGGLFLWRNAVAKKLGNDYRVWIESSTPGTYNEIKGNTSLTINRNGATIDTSSKENFPYATQAGGMRTMSISATFRPDLPDATGYGRLVTLANGATSTPFNIQIRKGGSAGADADAVFEGSLYATDLNDTMSQNAVVETSATFVIAAAPTTDALS
jgi:predicted secreted protein